MPFSSSSFDSVICCYVLELLSADDIRQALREIRRVLRPGAICGLIVVAENGRIFNQLYDTAGMLVPALWGRQVERAVPDLMREAGFQLVGDYLVRQMGYPSRVLIAEKRPLKGANRQSTELPETPA